MTAIALALVALGLIQLDGRRLTPANGVAALMLVCAAAVALVNQAGW